MQAHDQDQDGRAAQLNRHSLFPALAALWCASVFGIGGLALGSAPLEQLVQLSRLDTVLPAAAPPLGFTARMLVAAALALIGGGGAFILARVHARLSGSSPPAAAPHEIPASGQGPADDDNDDLARLEAAREALPLRRRALIAESEPNPAPPPLSPLDVADLELDQPGEQPEPVSSLWPAPDLADASPRGMAPQGTALDTLSTGPLVEQFTAAVSASTPRRLTSTEDLPADTPAPFADSHFANPEVPPTNTAPAASPDPVEEPASPPTAPAPADVTAPPPLAGPAHELPTTSHAPEAAAAEWFDADAEEPGQTTFDSLLPRKRPAAALLGRAELPAEYAEELARWALPEPDEDPEAEEALLDDAPEEEDDGTFSSLHAMRPSARVAIDFAQIDNPAAQLPGAIGRSAEPVMAFPGRAMPAPPISPRLPGTPFAAGSAQTEQALREALAALQKKSDTV